MSDAFESLLNFSLYNLAFNFISLRNNETLTKEIVDNEINFQFLYFKKQYYSLDFLDKPIIKAKINKNGEVNLSHLNFGSVILENDNWLNVIYKFDFLKVSYHKYYCAALLNNIYTLFEFENPHLGDIKKIKGVVVAAFFRHLSDSNIFPRGKEERVIDYCQRINLQFHLPLHSRIETDFGISENRFESIKSEILPYIEDLDTRKVLEKYFDDLSK
jgi:hypothetical protein